MVLLFLYAARSKREKAIRIGSVLNRPGRPEGPGGGLQRAQDEMGRRNVVRPCPGIPRATIIGKDDGPHDLRQLLVWTAGDDIGLRGMAGGCKGP